MIFMESVGFNRVIALFLAIFTICASVPVSVSAKEAELSLPKLNVEIMETLNVTSTAPDGVTNSGNKSGKKLPESYSSVEKGYVTTPKDQGEYGTCWTFAAASMAESSILSQGERADGRKPDVNKINFSEAQIAYLTYSDSYDPLGNLNGDGTHFLGSDVLYCGGNHYFTSLSLAAWKGLCEDSVMPYDEFVADSSKVYDTETAYSASVRLENAVWTNMTDAETVKNLIVENGSVLTDYFHDDMFFNEETAAYYCAEGYVTNHAITLVGWDDNYSRENFLTTPEADGAWLVKNSWGEDWGDNGYFWLSYYDATLMYNAVTCMQFTSADTYDNNYQYDGSCLMSYLELPSGMLVANSFTTSAYEQEKLEAVSFAVMSGDVDYKIRIFKNNEDMVFVDGEEVLDKPIEGHVDNTGYYTIPIEEEVILEKGEEYTVCIIFSSESSPSVYVMIDSSALDEVGRIAFTNNTENDRSYYGMETPSTDSGLYMADLVQANGVTARIKAFTSNVGAADDEDDDRGGSFWEELFKWFHTIINGVISDHKSGEVIDLVAEFFFDEKGYAHRFNKWVCDEGHLDINEGSSEISFVMPEEDIQIHAEYVIVGDVDGNEKINAFDVIGLSKTLKSGANDYISAADINGDGKLNAFDSINMKKYMLGRYEITK